MPENITINVSPQTPASVDVRADNVASYYYELAKQWAISPDLVEQLDYSSKYYAFVSKDYKEEVDALLSDSGFIAVKNDLANIDTVATNITNVNTVANNITDINTVASISSDITTVAGISSDVTAVNNNATNINACVSNASNINTVAGSIANVNTVADDKTNIDTVAGNTSNINTVASISTDISSVSSISSAVSAVNTNASNINAVSNDLTNINSVASDLTNIDSVVGMSSAITTVNSNSTNINTCASGMSEIQTCAANISTIATKMNVNMDNADILAYFEIKNTIFPSGNATAITVQTTGSSYSMGATGWLYVITTNTHTSNASILLSNTTKSYSMHDMANAGVYSSLLMPVSGGDSITLYYNNCTIAVFSLIEGGH